MAENYISQAYTWVTGNTITAARLNSNISALISGLSDGTKAVNINKLLIGAQAVFTLSSTDINVTNLNTVSMKNDLTIYKPTNDGNPKIVLGASVTEALFITAEYGSGTQTLQKATFNTKTASATADYGQFVFSVDEVEVINFKDALVTITGGLNMSGDLNINTNKFNVTASSGNTLIAGTLGVTGAITGTLATAAQGNITSLGTLTGLTINGTLVMGSNSITITGSIGATGARVTKGWFIDLECTNNIVANLTGNCSGSSGSCTGNAATASAVAASALTGNTLASGVTASSLTSVGTLVNLTVTNKIIGSISGNCDGSSGSCTGNAATASAVAAANLTGNTLASGITASSLTSVGTLTSLNVGNVVSTGTLRGYIYNESGDSNYDLKMKCVDIGSWDMDANASGPTVTLFAGANYCSRILMAEAWIRKDDGAVCLKIDGAGTLNGYMSISYNSTNTVASLGRAASGSDFDNTSYNDTGISRGYICVWYH